MQSFDETVHQSTRFQLLRLLLKSGPGLAMDFMDLMGAMRLTGGNLGGHLLKLEKTGCVRLEKSFVGKRPRTEVRLTAVGLEAFRDHVGKLAVAVREAEALLTEVSTVETISLEGNSVETTVPTTAGTQVGIGGGGESFID